MNHSTPRSNLAASGTPPTIMLLPLVVRGVHPALVRALQQEGIPTTDADPTGECKFHLFDSAATDRPELRPHQVGIDVRRLSSIQGLDPWLALEDEQSARRFWQLDGLVVSEQVSRIDKRKLRWQLLGKLREALELAGGVWARVAPVPYPFRTAFNFRIDHDDYVPEDFHAVMQIARQYSQCMSHFVCAADFVDRPAALDAFRDLDVGSHGFRHHTYHDAPDNARNIAKGIEALRQAGLAPRGFVAPHGKFHRGLLAAMQSQGLEYSSEFSLAYDEWPFTPAGGSIPQMPVHPICLGICLEAARAGLVRCSSRRTLGERAAEITLLHFRRILRERADNGEPIFLYGHPSGRLGRYPYVLAGILESAIQSREIWPTTLSQFSQWWQKRIAVQVQLIAKESGYEVRASNLASDAAAFEIHQENRVAALPLQSEVSFVRRDELSFLPRGGYQPLRVVQKTEHVPLKQSFLRYIDWEKETPVEELSAKTWRSWTKRVLRRIKA